jgi:CHAD domain-containing protein
MENDYIRLKEIKPALVRYISDAQELLVRTPMPDDEAIHDIRVLLKKARASLKLIRNQLELEYAEKDIVSLREAARVMAQWRDNSVQRKTLKELKKENPVVFAQLEGNEEIETILKKREASGEPAPEAAAGIEQISDLFKKTAYRVRFHSLDNLDPMVLLRELDKTYLRATDAFLTCRNNPKETKLHEFRKKSKDFMYQLYFFRPLNSDTVKSLENKLAELTGNLGKVNDLAQLVKALDYSYPNEDNSTAMNELVVHIREKQDEYLHKVWPAASKIFNPGRKLVNVLGYKILVI